jgi:hypothetical protein
MSRPCNTRHPDRGRSNYPARKAANGGADVYGQFDNGVRRSADRLMSDPKPVTTKENASA